MTAQTTDPRDSLLRGWTVERLARRLPNAVVYGAGASLVAACPVCDPEGENRRFEAQAATGGVEVRCLDGCAVEALARALRASEAPAGQPPFDDAEPPGEPSGCSDADDDADLDAPSWLDDAPPFEDERGQVVSFATGKPLDAASLPAPFDLSAILAAPPASPPWAVPGWFCRGDLVLFAGEAGAGKSAVSLDLAFAAASGGLWLGSLALEDHLRVSVLDLEMSRELAAHRLRAQAIGRGLDAQTAATLPLAYRCGCRIDLRGEDGWRALEEAASGADVVILDSLVRVVGDLNLNDSAAVSEVFGRLRRVAESAGAALIVLHHLRKRPQGPRTSGEDGPTLDAIRGSSDLAASCDAVWLLGRSRTGRELVAAKARWCNEPPSLSLRFQSVETADPEAGVFRVEAIGDGSAQTEAAEVLQLVKGAGAEGILRSAIIAALVVGGRSKTAASKCATRALGMLKATGRVFKATRGKEAIYWASASSPQGCLSGDAANG